MELDSLSRVVLPDISPYIQGGHALTGSAAYRQLLGLKEKQANDVDLVVHPQVRGTVASEILSPDVKRQFFITILYKTGRGYRYGLVHKKTLGWVDLFPRLKRTETQSIKTDIGQLEVETLEAMMWGLCISVLERSQKGQRILESSLDKIKFLEPYISSDRLARIIANNLDETTPEIAATIKKFKGAGFIGYTLESCQPFEPPGFDLYNSLESTPGGLSVESESSFRKVMDNYHKAWPNKIV